MEMTELQTKEEYMKNLAELNDWAPIIGEWKENPNCKQWVEEYISKLSHQEHYQFIRNLAELYKQVKDCKYSDDSDKTAWEELTSTVLISKPEQRRVTSQNCRQHLTKLMSNPSDDKWIEIKEWFDIDPAVFQLAVYPNYIGAILHGIRVNNPDFSGTYGSQRWTEWKNKIIKANQKWFDENQPK